MYKASRTWGSPENVFLPSGSSSLRVDDGAWGMFDGAWDEFEGAWGGVVEMGGLEDADRNMSCHAGVVAEFGSEYGTSSMVDDDTAKHTQRRQRQRERFVFQF